VAVVVDAQGAARATGRRKEAIVRVRVTPGTGQWALNGRSLEEYFPNKVHQQLVNEPFKVLTKEPAEEDAPPAPQYDVVATLRGGGVTGQAGALRLGIARALMLFNIELRKKLKGEGLVSRDSRAKERKKYGQKGARRRFQFSKR